MARRDGRRSPKFTLVVMVLLSVTILTVDSRDVPVLSSVRSGAADVFAPVGRGAASVTKPVRDWWGGLNDYGRLEKENDELRDRIAELEGSQAENEGAAEELRRLQEQLDLPFAEDLGSVIAQVSSGPFSNFDNNVIRIDKGSSAGIAEGMPVVTAAGLVGTVVSVTTSTCVVRLLTDPELRVGVLLAGTGNYAIGRGSGPNSPFIVDEGVELIDPVEVDETIFTSGLENSLYPKGIPIGRVSAVARSQSDQSQKLEVRLFADMIGLNYLQVLLWQPAD